MTVKNFVLAESRNSSKKALVDWCTEMLENYDCGASKYVSKIVTDDESWIYVHGTETKQQFTVCLQRHKSKSNKSCLSKNYYEANGGLFLLQNCSCGNCFT